MYFGAGQSRLDLLVLNKGYLWSTTKRPELFLIDQHQNACLRCL